MNTEQTALYHRIQSFSVDKPGSEFPFSQRLAHENGWTVEYTQRVIEEYKKFAFLAAAAGHPVTLSDQCLPGRITSVKCLRDSLFGPGELSGH